MSLLTRLTTALAALLLVSNGFATTIDDDIPRKPNPNALGEANPDSTVLKTPSSTVKFSGYLDLSYNYLASSNRFLSGNYDRVNDLNQNGFTFQQLAGTLTVDPEQGFGWLVNGILGRDANDIAPQGWNPEFTDNQQLAFAVPQAYIDYKLNQYTFLAGEMLSLAGFEQYDYTQDTNFSRSILDGYAQAGIHVGFRAVDQINDRWGLVAGINNGWSTIQQINKLDMVEWGVVYAPEKAFSLTINGVTGKEHATENAETGPTGWRHLLDIFGTLTINDSLSFAMNYDYGIQTKAALPQDELGRATWQGIALYLNYTIDDKWQASLRGELFDDSEGFRTGIRQNWRELTLTLGYSVFKALQLRAETRHDFSNQDSFAKKTGVGDVDYQQSYALEALYQF